MLDVLINLLVDKKRGRFFFYFENDIFRTETIFLFFLISAFTGTDFQNIPKLIYQKASKKES